MNTPEIQPPLSTEMDNAERLKTLLSRLSDGELTKFAFILLEELYEDVPEVVIIALEIIFSRFEALQHQLAQTRSDLITLGAAASEMDQMLLQVHSELAKMKNTPSTLPE